MNLISLTIIFSVPTKHVEKFPTSNGVTSVTPPFPWPRTGGTHHPFTIFALYFKLFPPHFPPKRFDNSAIKLVTERKGNKIWGLLFRFDLFIYILLLFLNSTIWGLYGKRLLNYMYIHTYIYCTLIY